MKRSVDEREHPLVIAFSRFLEVERDLGYGSTTSYLSGARRIMDGLVGAGFKVPCDLEGAAVELRRLYFKPGGLARLLPAGVPQRVHVNTFETFLARGLPLARRWYDDAVRTLEEALAYLGSSLWREHLAPLVAPAGDHGFRVRRPRTDGEQRAVAFVNSAGRCADCGRFMAKGVVRERRQNKRTGDRSWYLAVTCGETSNDNPCHRGWRASEARHMVLDSVLVYNPELSGREREV